VLAQVGAVPDDASVVVVAGPKIDFFPNEIDALKKYSTSRKTPARARSTRQAGSPPLTSLLALATTGAS
jgi:hypothetical protein